MKKSSLLLTLLGLGCSFSVSALELLDDGILQSIDGQAGMDLSLELSLNHKPITSIATGGVWAYDPSKTPQFDSNVCDGGKLEYCRLALIFNNRTVDKNGNPLGSNDGRKQWITFKGVQGTINIQRLGIDGGKIQYTPKSGSATIDRPAVYLSFDETKPLQIRNLGFQSLAIETDTCGESGTTTHCISSSSSNTPGYLNTTKYEAAAGAFDANNPFTGTARERGFLGVNMNANVQISGKVAMFSCAASGSNAHPRC